MGNAVWVRYCTDGLDFNTARLHLTSTPTGIFTVDVAGFYRVNFFAVANNCDGALVRLIRNGLVFHQGVEQTSVNFRNTDTFAHAVWPFNAGDTFDVQLWGGSCASDEAYLAWNAEGATSRLQMEYLGPVE